MVNQRRTNNKKEEKEENEEASSTKGYVPDDIRVVGNYSAIRVLTDNGWKNALDGIRMMMNGFECLNMNGILFD